MLSLLFCFLQAGTQKEAPKKDIKVEESQKENKKAEKEEEQATILDLDQNEVLAVYTIDKKEYKITRKQVVDHLESIGLNLKTPKNKSHIKEMEIQAASFLSVLHRILPIAKEKVYEEIKSKLKFMEEQMILGSYLEKEVMTRLDQEKLQKDAREEVLKARKGQLCYDIFAVVCKSQEIANNCKKELLELIKKPPAKLIVELESIAKKYHQYISPDNVKHPALAALLRTNGNVLPRDLLIKEDPTLVYLLQDLIGQFLGESVLKEIKKVRTQSVLTPVKINGYYVVIFIIDTKEFSELSKLVEMMIGEEIRKIAPAKQKEIQIKFLEDFIKEHSNEIQVMKDGVKSPVDVKKVLDILTMKNG